MEQKQIMVPEQDHAYQEARSERLETRKKPVWGEFAMQRQREAEKQLPLLQEEVRALNSQLQTLESGILARFGLQSAAKREQIRQARVQRELSETKLNELRDQAQNSLHEAFIGLIVKIRQVPTPERKQDLQEQLLELFRAPETVNDVSAFLKKEPAALTFDDIHEAVKYNSKTRFTSEILRRAIETHAQRIRAQEPVAEVLVERFKQEFLSDLQDDMKIGAFPRIPLETLENRLRLVKGKVHDDFVNPKEATLGTHNADGGISLSSRLLRSKNTPQQRETIYHELLHEISGRSTQTEIDETGKLTFHDRKSGLEVREQGSPRRFTWLNEATTEWLATSMAYIHHPDDGSAQSSNAYSRERLELYRLFDAGLSRQTLLEAYVENIRSDSPTHERGRAFKRLVQTINEIEGPDGFTRLNNAFELREAKTAVLNATNSLESDEFMARLRRGRIPEHLFVQRVHLRIGKGKAAQREEVLYLINQSTPSGEDERTHHLNQQERNQLQRILDREIQLSGQRISYSIETPIQLQNLQSQLITQQERG